MNEGHRRINHSKAPGINYSAAELRSIPADEFVLGHSSSQQAARHSDRKIDSGVSPNFRLLIGGSAVAEEKALDLTTLMAAHAHDVRNSLSLVRQTLELVRDNIKDASLKAFVKRAIARIDQAVEHSRYVADLLKGSQEMQPTDIGDVVNDAIAAKPIDEAGHVRLHLDIESHLPAVMADPRLMGAVFINLIENAFYAMKERKNQEGDSTEMTLFIGAQKKDNNIIITIQDTGTGIPEEIIDRITDPNFTTKGPSGQGLGLYSVVQTLRAHEATLEVATVTREMIQNDPRYLDMEPGTNFRITLPIYQPGSSTKIPPLRLH